MRHDPVDVGHTYAADARGCFDCRACVRHGVFENIFALHAQKARRLRRRRTAVDVKQIVQTTIRIKFGVQHAAIGGPALAFARAQHNRTGAIAEQHAGRAIRPVHQTRHRFRADHEHGFRSAGLDEIVGRRDGEHEARAHRLHVEACAACHAETRLNTRGDGGKRFVGRRRGDDDQIEFARRNLRIGECGFRGFDGEIGCLLARLGDTALANAGALDDPFVARVDAFGEFGVGENGLRQIRAESDDLRTNNGHEAAAPAACVCRGTTAARSARIFGITSALAISIAISSALANPIASVPPWLFTTTPFSPRKIPPFAARGSSLRRNVINAPLAMNAPSRLIGSRLSAVRRKCTTSLAVPSAVLSATLPVKPSVTMTSTVPSAMSSPSTKPQNSIGSLALRRICAAPRTASLPFTSSAPTFRMPTVGRSSPRIARAKASPMTAKSTSCCASLATLAPTSSTTLCPRLVGHRAAMAGRSMPSNVRSWNIDIAINAPVLPAEIATSASFFFTDSIARHIEVLRPRRSTALGLSSMRTCSA